ncbi:hypothetical protein AC244_16775 [Ensifer adhaerens]|uniref:Uncharacterized protein n=1 Tax=Ensifer adhaerens TaxID=106592 RepID=A0A0L8BSJ6_ENSAD|nr:hypothetical protein [Ensifer adhaerens]KOF17681.1 hypothetical protein AC244_16775 [Ensifer adhaerens]
MLNLPDPSAGNLSATEAEMLQRIFNRVCVEERIPKMDIRAERLAKFIIDEFDVGNREEESLLECARWLVRCKKKPPVRTPAFVKKMVAKRRH